MDDRFDPKQNLIIHLGCSTGKDGVVIAAPNGPYSIELPAATKETKYTFHLAAGKSAPPSMNKRFCPVNPTLAEAQDPKRLSLEGFVRERISTITKKLFLEVAKSNTMRWFMYHGQVALQSAEEWAELVSGGYSQQEIEVEWARQINCASTPTTGPFPPPSDWDKCRGGDRGCGETPCQCGINAEWPEEVDKEAPGPVQQKPKASCPWCGDTGKVSDEYGRPSPCSCTMRRDAPQDRLGHDATVALAQKVTWAYKPSHETMRDGSVCLSERLINTPYHGVALILGTAETTADVLGHAVRDMREKGEKTRCLSLPASR